MEKGFTIIELVISIFVLAIAIVGIFTAFSIMVILTSEAADRLTATYLAQEGMEIVRNIRDTNWLNPAATWVDGFSTAPCDTSGCMVDYTTTGSGSSPMLAWSGGNADYLYVSNINGFYGYNPTNATQTKFQRKIVITPLNDGWDNLEHIIKVTIQVSWDKKASIVSAGRSAGNCDASGSGANCIITISTLYNWFNPAQP